MNFTELLIAREKELGRPVKVGLAGAGQMGSGLAAQIGNCLLYTSPSPRDMRRSRMPSSA